MSEFLVVGDILIDRYLLDNEYYHRLGCVGNVVKTLEELRVEYHLLTAFPRPDVIYSMFKSIDISSCTHVFEANGEENVVDYKVVGKLTKKIFDEPKFCENIQDLEMSYMISGSSASKVLVSDYGLGAIGPMSKAALRNKFKESGVFSFVDARCSNYSDYFGATWLFPTELEASKFFLDNFLDYDVKLFSKLLSVKGVVLKRGSKGLIKYENDDVVSFSAMGDGQIVDTYGAGDILMALIAAVAKNETISNKSITLVMDFLSEKLSVNGSGFLVDDTDFL